MQALSSIFFNNIDFRGNLPHVDTISGPVCLQFLHITRYLYFLFLSRLVYVRFIRYLQRVEPHTGHTVSHLYRSSITTRPLDSCRHTKRRVSDVYNQVYLCLIRLEFRRKRDYFQIFLKGRSRNSPCFHYSKTMCRYNH